MCNACGNRTFLVRCDKPRLPSTPDVSVRCIIPYAPLLRISSANEELAPMADQKEWPPSIATTLRDAQEDRGNVPPTLHLATQSVGCPNGSACTWDLGVSKNSLTATSDIGGRCSNTVHRNRRAPPSDPSRHPHRDICATVFDGRTSRPVYAIIGRKHALGKQRSKRGKLGERKARRTTRLTLSRQATGCRQNSRWFLPA